MQLISKLEARRCIPEAGCGRCSRSLMNQGRQEGRSQPVIQREEKVGGRNLAAAGEIKRKSTSTKERNGKRRDKKDRARQLASSTQIDEREGTHTLSRYIACGDLEEKRRGPMLLLFSFICTHFLLQCICGRGSECYPCQLQFAINQLVYSDQLS